MVANLWFFCFTGHGRKSCCSCSKVLFIWKFIFRSSPQEYLFFPRDMLTVLGLDRARQKCPSEPFLQAQPLLSQPGDPPRPQLGENRSPAGAICLAERTVLSHRELPPAGPLFLANEEIALLLAVYNEIIALALIWLYAQESKITDIPVSWKMAGIIHKNGRYLRSWSMSCAFSLLWLFCWFMLAAWKTKMFVSPTHSSLPPLRHRQNWVFLLNVLLHLASTCVQNTSAVPCMRWP